MKKICTPLIALLISLVAAQVTQAQDTGRVYFTTGVGMVAPLSGFANAYRNSLALNSGIEYKISKHYFAQFVLDFNAIRYSQQIKDAGSPYLFQNTSSSVFLAGIHAGRNIALSRSGRFFASPYLGLGYANIGEPRLKAGNTPGVFVQQVNRMKGLFTRQGLRLGLVTRSKILQTLYADVSHWSAHIRIQDSRPQTLSLLVGTRFGF